MSGTVCPVVVKLSSTVTLATTPFVMVTVSLPTGLAAGLLVRVCPSWSFQLPRIIQYRLGLFEADDVEAPRRFANTSLSGVGHEAHHLKEHGAIERLESPSRAIHAIFLWVRSWVA